VANTILTIDMITRAAVSLFKNSNMFIQNLDTQYDDQFAVDGAKIGDTLRIRLPNDFTVRHGTALSIQNTAEKFTSLSLSTQVGVDVAFSSAERALKLDDYSERVLMPMMNDLAADIAADVMSDVEGNVCNLVSNTQTDGTIISPTIETILLAKAALANNSTPTVPGFKTVLGPNSEARIVSTLAGQFNPSQGISEQYRTGQMKNALGFDFFMDQTVINHKTGSFTAGTVNGANQSGSTIAVNAITGSLNKGDIITFENVNAVNRLTKDSLATLRQFVVTADAASGATSLSIYPELVPPSNGNKVQYQTVDSSPADAATIALATPAGGTYVKNISYSPKAVTLATADLVLPRGVHEASRRMYDGISMRMITDYVMGTDQLATRLDVIYGKTWLRGEWGVILADKAA
jgi:hypothetical protein